jgi:RND family efflux transporter MFP subunit
MNKKTATVVGIFIVVVTVAIVIALFKNPPETPKKPMNVTLPLVEVLVPVKESVQFTIESHGVVQARTETALVSEVSGVVQKVSDKFVAGGFFKAGEVLLTLDPTDYQVAVEQAKARLAGTEAQYAQEKARAEQAQKEWDLSGRSRKEAPPLALREPFLLEAKANVDSARADLKKAEQKLARTVIRAPYDGMVKSRAANIGQFVSMGAQLGVIFAIDKAEVRLPLTDKELAFITMPNWGEPLVLLAATFSVFWPF